MRVDCDGLRLLEYQVLACYRICDRSFPLMMATHQPNLLENTPMEQKFLAERRRINIESQGAFQGGVSEENEDLLEL